MFAGAMFLGRLAADRLVDRFGRVRPFPAGTLGADAGLGVALLLGGSVPALIGFVAHRFGLTAGPAAPVLFVLLPGAPLSCRAERR